jgi:hypothetical protein
MGGSDRFFKRQPTTQVCVIVLDCQTVNQIEYSTKALLKLSSRDDPLVLVLPDESVEVWSNVLYFG